MKKEIIVDVVFIVSFFFFLFAINQYMLDKGKGLGRIRPTINVPSDTYGVIIGTSHTNNAFTGLQLKDGVSKIALGARQSIMDAYLQIKYLTEKKIKLKYVLLEDDPVLLSKHKFGHRSGESVALFYSKLSDVNEIFDKKYTYLDKLRGAIPILKSTYRTAGFQNFFLKQHPSTTAKVTKFKIWHEKTNRERRLDARRRAVTFFSPKPTKEIILKAYIKVIEFCRMNEIKIIGIRYPITKEYHQEKLKLCLDPINKVKLKYPPDEVWDYQLLFLDNPDCFKDPDHLSDYGRGKFQKILLKKFKQLDI